MRQKTAILRGPTIAAHLIMAAFLFAASFNVAFAASDSIFGSANNPIDWVKNQLVDIFSDEEKDAVRPEGGNLMVSQDSYVVKVSPPDSDSVVIDQRRELVITYKVEDGDTLMKVASDFGISLNTLLWANDLTARSVLRVNQELKILPIDGVLYTVKKGDNISAISQKYKTDNEQIIDFNDLPADGALKVGMDLILPNGVAPTTLAVGTTTSKSANTSKTSTVKKATSAVASATKQAAQAAFAAAEKLFIIPVSGILTQGRHSYTPPAVDIGNSCGTPIFAAADGVVTSVFETSSRSTYAGGGYGNNIKIQHVDGSMSLYAHLYAGSLDVSEGQTVKQGQKIAEIGGGWAKRGLRMAGAGRSTGCHLHFEVRNGVNPLTKYRRGTVLKTPAAELAIDSAATGAGDGADDNQGTGFSGIISEPFQPKTISEPYKAN